MILRHLAELIEFPTVRDERGALTYLDECNQIPFEIKRIYYLHDLGTSSMRGGHAHYEMEQILIALAGSFLVKIHDGDKWKEFSLQSPSYGLYVPKMNWREIINFSSRSICLSVVSTEYSEKDYIRDFNHFISSSRK